MGHLPPTHKWAVADAEKFGRDPFAGLPPAEREIHTKARARRLIERRIERITRSEPSALYLNDIPGRKPTIEDFLSPGETFEPSFDGVQNGWPGEYLTPGRWRK